MTPLDLPDLPRWVEAHGIAADAASWRRDFAGGAYAVGSDRSKLIVLAESGHEAASITAARDLIDSYPTHTLLVATHSVAQGVGGRAVERAILHTLPDASDLPVQEGAVILESDAPTDHLRPEVIEELVAARGHRAVWSAWIDGVPVAFAHAPWRSATLFDLSVDVAPTARQLGLGALVASAAIRAERAEGREPVWGADENNVASQRLAHRLGFVAVDAIHVLAPVRT